MPGSATAAAGAVSAVRAGTVTGTVTTSDAADPIVAGGVSVALYTGQLRKYSAEVNASGGYSISGVAPGQYSVLFSGLNQHADEWYDDAASQDAGKTITVVSSRATEHVDAELKATPSGSLGGDVYTHPTEYGPNVPQANVEVRAHAEDGTFRAVLTNSDGHYTFATLPVGHYKIQFMGKTSAPVLPAEWSTNSADEAHAYSYVVSAGGNTIVNEGLLSQPPFSSFGNVAILGDARVGSTLSVDQGTWTPQPTSGACTWRRGDHVVGPVGGACTYAITAADIGHVITLQFNAVNGDRFSNAVYVTTAVVQP